MWQAAGALSQVLSGSSSLKDVDMSSSELGVEGGRSLREAVSENR